MKNGTPTLRTIRTLTQEINIAEVDGGWLWRERDRKYKAAANALKAVKRDARHITKHLPNTAVIQVISWHPRTTTGRIVCKALGAGL